MKKTSGIKRVVNAFHYSLHGLRYAWLSETSFRHEIITFLIAIIVVVLLELTLIERILLLSTVFLVIIVELLNSAIESTVDRIGHEYHELSGRAKDFSSAAVFCSILLASFVWIAILSAHYLT